MPPVSSPFGQNGPPGGFGSGPPPGSGGGSTGFGGAPASTGGGNPFGSSASPGSPFGADDPDHLVEILKTGDTSERSDALRALAGADPSEASAETKKKVGLGAEGVRL